MIRRSSPKPPSVQRRPLFSLMKSNGVQLKSDPMTVAAALVEHAREHGAREVIASPAFKLLEDSGPEAAFPRMKATKAPVVAGSLKEKEDMVRLIRAGVDGLITDDPALLREVLKAERRLDAKGLVPPGFSAQGHRGARNLRPENTLPAMEAALDALMNVLETDLALTSDGVLVLSHSYAPEAAMVTSESGPQDPRFGKPFRQQSLSQLRQGLRFNGLLPDRPAQRNELTLSPVSVAFARKQGLPDAYSLPTLQDLFDFAQFYAWYYRRGPGVSHPEASQRALNAERVQFSLEPKVTPETEGSGLTATSAAFARAVGEAVKKADKVERSLFQSFDPELLMRVHRDHPQLKTVFLFD